MTSLITLSRRQLLTGMSATLGTLALRGFDARGDSPVYYTHGIASGDPLQDRIILWTRVLPGDGVGKNIQGRWQIATDQRFTSVVAEGKASTSPERDNTVKIDAAGLEPGKQYFYRFIFDGVPSPVGRTRTLPAGSVEKFRIGVCSCAHYTQGYFNVYRDMARADIDLVMHLGDYLYEYPNGFYDNPPEIEQLERGVTPENELFTLDDYRQRYGFYRMDADLQAAHAAHPWITVWDDHEFANNTWRAGADNHNEGEGDFFERMAIARRVYHEWMPIRSAPQGDQGPIFRSFPVGTLADLIMLDTRLHGRDEALSYWKDMTEGMTPDQFRKQLLGDPERTILGLDQEAWLAGQLAASVARGATWQFIGQQVLMGKQFIPKIAPDVIAAVEIPDWSQRWIATGQELAPHNMPMNLDGWDGYPACRDRTFESLLKVADNPVVVAGDSHNAWAFNLANEKGVPVGVEVGCPSITSLGLKQSLPIESTILQDAFLEGSPELVDIDTTRAGWAHITLTPEATYSHWRLMNTVLSQTFSVTQSEELRCARGERRFA